ncbi:MAG: hypothetical protein Q7S73_02260 [bacterium]|nr:hypothetical protein [bacterium]
MRGYLEQNQFYKRQRNFRIKIYLYFLAIFLVLIGIFYIIFFSPIFKVRGFKISGQNRLSNDSVLKILEPLVLNSWLLDFLGKENLLTWSRQDLNLSGTSVLSAKIHRDWIRQVVLIDIKERIPLGIWCGKTESCYWLDEDGIAFEEAPETEGSLILIVYDNSAKSAALGEKVVEERFSKNLTDILKAISKMSIPVKKSTFDKTLQELHIATYEGPDLFFSIRFNPELNLASLRSLKEKGTLGGMQYIDLRIENKIFYKL